MFVRLVGAAFVGTAGAAGAPVSIPFSLEDGAIVVEVRIDEGPPLPFLFDSGLSNGNLISIPAARLLGLRPQGALRFGDTSGSGHPAQRTGVRQLVVGKAKLGPQKFAIADLSRPIAERPAQPPIAGVLGAPLLEGAVLCIDYRHRRLQRWSRSAFDPAGYTVMPLHTEHGLPVATAILDGVPARLVVDTGNNGGVAVFPSYAEASGLRARYPDFVAQQGTGGSGEHFEILRTTVQEVAVSANTILRDLPLILVPQAVDPVWGIDGLMGYGVLAQLDPCLDRDGRRLMWKAG